MVLIEERFSSWVRDIVLSLIPFWLLMISLCVWLCNLFSPSTTENTFSELFFQRWGKRDFQALFIEILRKKEKEKKKHRGISLLQQKSCRLGLAMLFHMFHMWYPLLYQSVSLFYICMCLLRQAGTYKSGVSIQFHNEYVYKSCIPCLS